MLDQLILAAALTMPGPCGFLSRTQVERTLHWHVTAARESEYHLPQTSGSLCTYDASEGTVLVTLPDHGSSFFQNNDLVDPFKNQLGLRVTGIGASAEMFDKRRTSVSTAKAFRSPSCRPRAAPTLRR
jgi:hypothetical protein